MKRGLRWLARGLWLAAWAGWVALGVGLYHHLPRTFGQAVCELPTERSSVGFIGDTNEVVVVTPSRAADGQPAARIEVIDAETGETLRSGTGPEWLVSRYYDLCKQTARGVWFLTDPIRVRGDGETLSKLDLKTMEHRELTHQRAQNVRLHPSKPWAAYVELPGAYERFDQATVAVSVLNYETGKATVVRRFPPRSGYLWYPFFLEGERLGIVNPGAIGADNVRKAGRVEVWKLSDPPVLEQEFKDIPWGMVCSGSESGRVLLLERTTGQPFDVYDLNAGRLVLSHPPVHERAPLSTMSPVIITPLISRDGRGVLAGDPPTLWDVDAGKPILKPSSYQELSQQESPDVFFVRELWYKLWEPMFPSTPKFRTIAYRRVADGGLVVRATTSAFFYAWNVNAKGDLVAANDGHVYRLPLLVNWMLLAVCQVVLALPLVLVWALVRWRRRRRLKLAAAA